MIALVRPPGPRLADGIVTHRERLPVDVPLAHAQHRAYVQALRDHGWEIVEVPEARELPDAVFVEDTVVIWEDLAVLTRPGAPERRPEVAGTASVAATLGLETAIIEPPGTLDGGDVLQVDHPAGSVVYVGRSGRTNDSGIAQLGELLRSRSRTVVPVDVRGALHLKSAVTALPDGTLVGHPDHVESPDLPEPIVPPEESGAHVVVLDATTVLMAASAPRSAARLEERGLRVVRVDIGEFEKLEGSVTCLSVLVRS
ncbi:MAG TPA: N(G),N(G)-dimethylarginine dimethylaminohydrolase [Actinopolymorphaceae bacterium]